MERTLQRGFPGFWLMLLGALAFAMAVPAQAEDEFEKLQKEREKKEKKEREKAEKEAQQQRERLAKLAAEQQKNGRDKASAKEGKAPLAPLAPAVREKTGEPLRDYVVDLETSFAASEKHFIVDEFTKHDYDACGACASKMAEAAKNLAAMHDDRLRQYGNDYHHQLKDLAKTCASLALAVKEHNRPNIFTYYTQLRLQRDALALTPPWRAE